MSRRTHLAIITEARDFAASRDFDSDGNMSTSILRYYLDLLDVAHRHEVQNALDAGGFVEASRKNKQVGNAAKLREALKKIDKIVWDNKFPQFKIKPVSVMVEIRPYYKRKQNESRHD